MKSEGRAHWFTPDMTDGRVLAGDHDVVWVWQYTNHFVGDTDGTMAGRKWVRILQRTTAANALPLWEAVGKQMHILEDEVHKLPVPYAEVEEGELALRLSDCMDDVDEGFARLEARRFIFCVVNLPLIGGGYRAKIMLMHADRVPIGVYEGNDGLHRSYTFDKMIGSFTVNATVPKHPEYKLAELGISTLVLESNEANAENICEKVTLHQHHVRLFARNGIIRSYDR
ncbi:MAG: hypothetical protein A2Y38_17215 [Spirochaetes bacterium GWB1_59_5]|nr:MAG: hypothetical protein A2Y38_17215 [Spirochaetes bacterium GWB1_59_5]